jgi:hypothetical protein
LSIGLGVRSRKQEREPAQGLEHNLQDNMWQEPGNTLGLGRSRQVDPCIVDNDARTRNNNRTAQPARQHLSTLSSFQ